MATAASEEYGLDVEHVETLQQAFDNFLAQLHGKYIPATLSVMGSNPARANTLCDPYIVILSLGVLCIHFMFVRNYLYCLGGALVEYTIVCCAEVTGSTPELHQMFL